MRTGREKIVSVEDPVEYELAGIGQTQVNPKIDLDFAKALRAILRQDPDVIMIGEIRDAETAQIAINSALTGHLVFTTVHANNVFDVLGRFTHMQVDPYSFAAALNGIKGQVDALARRRGWGGAFEYSLFQHGITRASLDAMQAACVERFDVQKSAEHADELTEAAKRGQSLAIFPEGTLLRRPGLLPFRMGAFQVAAEAGIPVVPIALRCRPRAWYDMSVPATSRLAAAAPSPGSACTAGCCSTS